MPADSHPSDLAHELATSLSALLLGFERLRKLSSGPDCERALALIDRMETTARGMASLVDALARAAPPAPHS